MTRFRVRSVSSALMAISLINLLWAPTMGLAVARRSITLALHWSQEGQLPRGSGGLAVASDGQYLYITGGFGGRYSYEGYSAHLMGGGALGLWQHIAPLPYPLYLHAMVYYWSALYTIGGTGGVVNQGATNAIFRAQVSAGGHSGAWKLTGTLPTGLYGEAALAHGAMLYVIGGYSPQVGYLRSVYAIHLGQHGLVGRWQRLTPLPDARFAVTAAIVHNTLYVIGGGINITPTNSVFAATINANGSLGKWRSELSLPTAVSYSTAANVANHLVVLGSGPVNAITLAHPRSVIYVAGVGNNGRIGAWHTATALPSPLVAAGSASVAGRLYLIGGYTGRLYTNSVLTTCPKFSAACSH